eukprot:jgi/Phyca11/536781/estExt2_fgenesh1_pg.C_PHYCAscaffold_630011
MPAMHEEHQPELPLAAPALNNLLDVVTDRKGNGKRSRSPIPHSAPELRLDPEADQALVRLCLLRLGSRSDHRNAKRSVEKEEARGMMKKDKPGERGLHRQMSAAPPPRRRAPSNYQTVEDVAAERGVSISRPPLDKNLPQQPMVALTSSGPTRPPRPGADSFELLQAKFGFQEGNVRNQKEHFECWVLNYESRILEAAVTPVDTENAIETIHAKFFRNYIKWCQFLRTQPYLLDTAPYPGAAERQIALFLLIWGESANLRFMPECLCFLYHKMAAKLDGIEKMPNAPEGTFLRRIVRPLYNVVAKMRNVTPQKNGAGVDHKNVTNYDDVNEFFWRDTCLNFDEFNVAEAVNVRDFKTFKERRSFCNPILAFFRIYFFLFVMLHILVVIAYVGYRSDPDDTDGFNFYSNFFTSDITDIRNHAFYSIFMTISGLLALKVVLDVWIDGTRIFSRIMYAVSVFVRLVWHTVFFGLFTAVNAAPYKTLIGSSDLLTMAPVFIGVYMVPIVIVSIVQMFFHGLIWRSALLSSLDGTREQYIGRTMGQSWGDFFCYGTFWTIIFACKFLFNLQLMVKPLIGPSVEIYSVDISAHQLENGIIESDHNIAFLAAMWAPVVLVYIYDSQIWLAIAQAIVGAWIGFRLKIGHSARIKEFVQRLQQAPNLFDEKVVSAAARGQLAINNNPLSSSSVAPDANSRLRFAVYQISDTGAVEEPVFLIAGEAQAAADISAKSKTKRMSDGQLFKELKKAGVLGIELMLEEEWMAEKLRKSAFARMTPDLAYQKEQLMSIFADRISQRDSNSPTHSNPLFRKVEQKGRDLSILKYLITFHDDEWGNFLERVGVASMDEALAETPTQIYSDQLAAGDSRAADIDLLMRKYPNWRTIDMNQEHYFEEALKIPNFLATATENGQNVTVIGMKEHIFTGRASSLAHFMTLQELVFSRMHYGHPDVFEKSFIMSNGGVSKASKGINLSEDVFAGYNVALRGEKVTHQEFMQCGKGRDVTLSQINAFEAKLSNGSAESSLSRESHRMGSGMDFFRLNSMFYGHMGFYICNALVVLCVFAYAYGKVYIVLHQEIEESAIITTSYLDDLAEVMNTQFIFQFGMLMTIPLIATLFVEYGWHQAVVNFVELIVTLGPVFYIFETGTKSHFYDVAIMRGGSKYRGTGRGFAIVRETMVNFYKEYAASHYRKAVELMGLMIIFGTYGNFSIDFDCDTDPDQIPSNITLLNSYSSKGQDYGIASFAVWLLVKEADDEERLLPNHMSSNPSGPQDSWNDFYNYEASLMYPIGPMSRFVYAVREFRHPLVMYYIFIFSFNLSDIGMLLACVGGIAVLLWIGGFGLGMCLRNKARVPRAMLYVLMVVIIGVAPFVVGSMQDWDGIKSFSLTIAIFTGLFSLLHYLQLLHGLFGLPIAKWGLVRELAFFFDVVVGLFLAIPLLILSAFPFMKTIQTRMMYNGGFSRALSSGNLTMIKVYAAAAGAVGVILSGGLAHGWKGKGVLMFLTSAALGFMIEAVLINDINATTMSKDWGNTPYHDWQWQFIFGIIPIVLLVPSMFFLPESHFWEYRRKSDPKAAEATLVRLRQRHDVMEEVNELKDSFVVKEGRPSPSQAGAQTSKWQIYYDNLQDVLPFSAALSAACGALGLADQEDSVITQILVFVAFVSGALSLICGTWITAIEVFPPYQNGRYIIMSFVVYYAVQAAIYVVEPSFAISHLIFAGLCLLLTVFMFVVCASSKYGAIELKSEKKMRKDAEAARNRPSFVARVSRSQSFLRSRSNVRRSSSHYSAAALTPQEGSYSNFESPAGLNVNGGTRRTLNGSQAL